MLSYGLHRRRNNVHIIHRCSSRWRSNSKHLQHWTLLPRCAMHGNFIQADFYLSKRLHWPWRRSQRMYPTRVLQIHVKMGEPALSGVDNRHTFICTCPPGTNPPICTALVADPCARIRCQNRATCIPLGSNRYRCACPRRFTGLHCQTELRTCSGVLTGLHGSLKFPSANNYLHNTHSAWIIRSNVKNQPCWHPVDINCMLLFILMKE